MEGLHRYFDKIASKRLSAVETSLRVSHQHEFNGVSGLVAMFGNSGRLSFEALHFDLDAMDEGPTHVESLTWYDARENHPTRTEWRLYYSAQLDRYLFENGIVAFAQRGSSRYIFTARVGGVGEHIFHQLFGDAELRATFGVLDEASLTDDQVSAAAQVVLAELGLTPRDAPEMESLVRERFPSEFPPGEQVSQFARANTFGVDALTDPDVAILAWLRVELEVFTVIETRLASYEMGAASSLDEKLAVAMRVFQRRRSRAGKALEYHLKALFDMHGIRYAHTPATEGNERPDFLFPTEAAYWDTSFPDAGLTMLASKQTVRDRWRQILQEAARIPAKHLFTTDPAITERQLDAMTAAGIVLVMPSEIRVTYRQSMADEILTVREFLELVVARDARSWT